MAQFLEALCTIHKTVDSILGGVIRIFYYFNPCGGTLAEVGTKDIS